MAAKLSVLVLESQPGGADRSRAELEARGHTVVGCHAPGRPVFPCDAIAAGRECPLEAGVVDVALVVRARDASQPTPREDGAACAIRRHVPLVVAGATRWHPYAPYAGETVDGVAGVVDACERTATAPLPAHSAAAARALQETLERRGQALGPEVSVLRRDGALVVRVAHAHRLDAATKGMAAVRMMAALRSLDHDSRGIDVSFDDEV